MPLRRWGVSVAPDLAGEGESLASPFLELLPVDGVAVSVLNQDHRASVLYASDDTAARLEEIQFDLGEGPLFECVTTARPVMITDMEAAAQWPMFAVEARETDAASIFVFPLTLGAASIGAVLCYSKIAGPLGADEVALGSVLSRTIAGPALRLAVQLADEEDPNDRSLVEMRREVHQATGMVLFQLDTTATDALARMRAYGFSNGISLRQVARDVVERRLDFSTLKD